MHTKNHIQQHHLIFIFIVIKVHHHPQIESACAFYRPRMCSRTFFRDVPLHCQLVYQYFRYSFDAHWETQFAILHAGSGPTSTFSASLWHNSQLPHSFFTLCVLTSAIKPPNWLSPVVRRERFNFDYLYIKRIYYFNSEAFYSTDFLSFINIFMKGINCYTDLSPVIRNNLTSSPPSKALLKPVFLL